MISLPKGCTFTQRIIFVVTEVPDRMAEWFVECGGRRDIVVDHSNLFSYKSSARNVVQYGKEKPSYYLKDGSGNVLIKFNIEDVNVAGMFMLTFFDYIVSSNLTEAVNTYEKNLL